MHSSHTHIYTHISLRKPWWCCRETCEKPQIGAATHTHTHGSHSHMQHLHTYTWTDMWPYIIQTNTLTSKTAPIRTHSHPPLMQTHLGLYRRCHTILDRLHFFIFFFLSWYSCRVELLDWSWIISTESNSTPFICEAVINGGQNAGGGEGRKCKLFRTKAPHKLASPFLKLYHYYILKMLICWADFPGELSKLVLFPRLPLCKGTAATSTSDLLITIRLPSLGSFKHW